MPLDDLLGLPRPARIDYVRKNLANEQPGAQKPCLTLDQFAAAVGASRQTPMRWAKGATPSRYADKIAALTPYPAEAFGAEGEAELVRYRFGRRLEALEEKVEEISAGQEQGRIGLVVRLDAIEAALATAGLLRTPPT